MVPPLAPIQALTGKVAAPSPDAVKIHPEVYKPGCTVGRHNEIPSLFIQQIERPQAIRQHHPDLSGDEIVAHPGELEPLNWSDSRRERTGLGRAISLSASRACPTSGLARR